MIRKLTKEEYNHAADLSYQVYMECGKSDFTQEGIETFKDFVYNTSLINALDFYGAFEHHRLIGIIGVNKEKQHILHIPADTRSAFPVISVHSPVSIQYRWQS